jgi:hypothetical protein
LPPTEKGRITAKMGADGIAETDVFGPFLNRQVQRVASSSRYFDTIFLIALQHSDAHSGLDR